MTLEFKEEIRVQKLVIWSAEVGHLKFRIVTLNGLTYTAGYQHIDRHNRTSVRWIIPPRLPTNRFDEAVGACETFLRKRREV